MGSVIARLTDRHGRRILLALCCALFVAQLYSAWSWPAIDGYPAIERFIDPGWLKADFYTNAVDGFGPDFIPAAIFGTLQKFTGISYTVWVALANFVRCVVTVLLLYGLLEVFTRDRDTALAGTILATLSGFMMPDAPGWYWIGGTAEPSGFALAFVMAGWICALQRKLWASALLMTAALLLHPVVALHGALFAGLVVLFDFSREERRAALRSWKTLLGGAGFAAVLVALYLAMAGGAHEKLSDAEYIRILAFERHAHHFVPSAFGARTWALFALSMTAFAAVLWAIWRSAPRRRLVLATLATYALLAAIGFVFVEIAPVRLVVQIIPYRFCIALCPVVLAVIAAFLTAQIREGRLLPAAMPVLVYLSAPLALGHSGGFWLHGAMLVLLGVSAAAVARSLESASVSLGRPFETRNLARAAGAGLALLTLSFMPPNFQIPSPENQHPIYKWMAANTPDDAVFLVAQAKPGTVGNRILSPQKVRLIGRRAVVASQDFPFREDYFHEWRTRWRTALLGGNAGSVNRLTEAELADLRGRFAFDYVLRSAPIEEPHSFVEIARIGSAPTVYVYAAPRQVLPDGQPEA